MVIHKGENKKQAIEILKEGTSELYAKVEEKQVVHCFLRLYFLDSKKIIDKTKKTTFSIRKTINFTYFRKFDTI